MAKALDEPVIADVAAYYAGQPKRNPNPATLAELPQPIVRLVELGDPNRNIRRAPRATGRAPAVRSRRPSCTSRATTTWLCSCRPMRQASGERRLCAQRAIATQLTPTEINGLAAYYAAGFR